MSFKKSFLVILLFLFLLTGCNNNQKQQTTINNPFVGPDAQLQGNAAINMYFQEGMPPAEVFDYQYPFSIGVVIENIGEYDIKPEDHFTVSLENLQPSLFGLTPADLNQVIDEELPGTERAFDGSIVPGKVAHVVFDNLQYQGTVQGMQVFPFRTKACFDYENYATTVLCFKKSSIENAQDSSLCTLNGEKPVFNSAGPLHLTKVRENALGKPFESNVVLTFEHVGSGEFYDPRSDDDCDTSVTNLDKYKAEITLELEGGGVVECQRFGNTNHGILTFYQGSPQTISCHVKGNDEGTPIYQNALNVKIRYRYGQFIEDKFIVRHVPREE